MIGRWVESTRKFQERDGFSFKGYIYEHNPDNFEVIPIHLSTHDFPKCKNDERIIKSLLEKSLSVDASDIQLYSNLSESLIQGIYFDNISAFLSVIGCGKYCNLNSDRHFIAIKSMFDKFRSNISKLDPYKLSEEERKYLGFRTFNDEPVPYTLIPIWIWSALPKGLPIKSIGGEIGKTGDDIDLDIRFGCIAWRLTIWDPIEAGAGSGNETKHVSKSVG